MDYKLEHLKFKTEFLFKIKLSYYLSNGPLYILINQIQ